MPIIKASSKNEKEQVRISIEKNILEEIKKYCDWADVKKYDDFFIQAAQFVLSKDKDWVKHLSEQNVS